MGPGREDPLRILFVPEVEGGITSERTPMLLRTMRERHTVVGLRAPWDGRVYDPERARWARAVLYVLDKALLGARGFILGRRHRVQVVFCETAHHALAGLVIARLLGARCLWDSHGNGKRFYESLGRGRWSVRLIAAFERFLGRRIDGLITVSPADASGYAGMGLPRSKIHVIPLCVPLADIDAAIARSRLREDGGPPALLFFGSFKYEPNREALRFVNEVLAPSLSARGIRCEIWVAGRDIPPMTFHPLVRPLGFVPDIYARIRAASLCIVPVRRGVGVLTKVLDSMAVGTPIVMTRFAAEGIPEIRDGVHAYVAGTDDEFLAHTVRALSEPEARRQIARNARTLVEEHFDWDRHLPDVERIIRGEPGGRSADVHAS